VLTMALPAAQTAPNASQPEQHSDTVGQEGHPHDHILRDPPQPLMRHPRRISLQGIPQWWV